MGIFKTPVKLAVSFLPAFLASSIWAVTASPSSVNVPAGTSQTVKLSNISRSVYVNSSAPGVATVSKVDSSTYRIYGASAGNAVISFKDSKTTSKVYVTVSTQTSSVLTGRLLASNCFQCHGTNGSGGFDKLAGESMSEIYGELKEFAGGKEDPNSVMAGHATGFSDAQMKLIATYFSSIR